MKTLLFAGLAGILAAAPGIAIAATDSNPVSSAPVDLSFASPTAIAASSQGMKTPRAKMGGHGMKMRGHKMRSHKMRGHKKMSRQSMKHRGQNMRGRGMKNRGHRGKRDRGFRGNRGGNFGYFVGGGFPSLGYSQPTYYVQQPTYRAQPQPSYYPVPYPVPVAVPAPAPTTVIVDTVAPKGKGLTKPAHRIATQSNHSVPYHQNVVANGHHGGPVTHSGTTYQGDWDGAYQPDGSYQGEWQGTYQDEQGRAYQGQYSGTFTGDSNAVPAGGYAQQAPAQDYYQEDRRYNRDQDELAYLERCKKSSGIGGAVVGGAIGALAGNRIAGRGNRLGGSLIGGGLGAVAGAAIDQGTDRCRKLLKKHGYDRDYARNHQRDAHYGQPVQNYRQPVQQHTRPYPSQQHYQSGWQGGYYPAYYYQQQAPQVTTVVIQSQPVTTTTTTTTIEEEYVYEKPRYVAKKRYKPAAKRVWKPRAKPAPVKGCQQANCYYDQ